MKLLIWKEQSQMKKFNLLTVVLLLLMSCQKDDEVLIPQCEIPTNLSESLLSNQSVVLHWESTNADSHIVEYGLTGFVRGEGTVVSTTNASVTLTGLLPETSYDYYVQAICSANNTSLSSSVNMITTLAAPVVPEFRQTLSELNLFQGILSDLMPSPYAFEYNLHTSLYTDYALKQRIIALPQGGTMAYVDDGLPNFPNNTVIAKTFYYNNDDRDMTLGKKIIETRVMIKINGVWEFGDYVWNEQQSEATLDPNGSTLPVSWIDATGATKSVNYQLPSQTDCFTCHQSNSQPILLGPKLRSMNFDLNGVNQLQKFISDGHLINAPTPASIGVLPNWQDETFTDEVRMRAYMDVNCAHCHSEGGFHNVNYFAAMDLRYEVPFDESNIYEKRFSIMTRIQTSVEQYSMPFIGVTTPHTEAVDLIVTYLQTLD